MTPILGLVFLVIIAIIGKYLLIKTHIKGTIQNFLIYSGFYYLLIGIILNPNLLNIKELSVFRENEFFFDFVLGWTGFLVGLQISIKGVKRFSLKYYRLSLLHFIVIFSVLAFFLIIFNRNNIFHLKIVQIFLLSIVGSMSSILSIGLLTKERKISSIDAYFLQFISAFDNIIGVIFLGGLFFIFQIFTKGESTALLFSGFAFVFTYLLALFYKILNEEFKTFEEESLLILGLILIVVGMARFLQTSILFISFLYGFFVVNMKVDTKKILLTVQEWEKPLNFILLFFIGLYLEFDIWELWPLIIVVAIVFLAGKYMSGLVYWKFKFNKDRKIMNKSNLVTFGMSSLSMAMVLDAYFTEKNPFILKLLTITVLMFYLSNLTVLYFYKNKKYVK